MDDIDFTAHFYMVAGKEYVVSKSEMTRVDANNYIANVDTSVTGSGASMKCWIDNLIPDGSWKEGIRPENVKTTIGEEIGNAF